MISTIQMLILLLGVVAAAAVVANRLKIPPAILLVLAGVLLALVPGLPPLELAPELVLLLILPSVIYTRKESADGKAVFRALRNGGCDSHRNPGDPMTLKIMMKYCLASGAAMTLMIATLPTMAYTGQELSEQAKVSITEARAIALKAHPGKIIATLLKPLGYATGQFGKNHLGDRDEMLPTAHGFEEFFGNLYHLNAEEEPENSDYPKDPDFKKKFGPRSGDVRFVPEADINAA